MQRMPCTTWTDTSFSVVSSRLNSPEAIVKAQDRWGPITARMRDMEVVAAAEVVVVATERTEEDIDREVIVVTAEGPDLGVEVDQGRDLEAGLDLLSPDVGGQDRGAVEVDLEADPEEPGDQWAEADLEVLVAAPDQAPFLPGNQQGVDLVVEEDREAHQEIWAAQADEWADPEQDLAHGHKTSPSPHVSLLYQ